MTPMVKEIECPRCGEADERPQGFNKCGLCECEFVVLPGGRIVGPQVRPRVRSAEAERDY
jgi:hypothetical protein